MDENRIFHDPKVSMYENIVTPGTRCAAKVYDFANRKWYRLAMDQTVMDSVFTSGGSSEEDFEWITTEVEKHIRQHFDFYGEAPPFNIISISANTKPYEAESYEVEYSWKPDHQVARQIRGRHSYTNDLSAPIPTITKDQLLNKWFLDRAIDRCLWYGNDCAFKQIEFDHDVKSLDREIQCRQTLFKSMILNGKDGCAAMERRFNVLPILAIVLDDGPDSLINGILMPFGGLSLQYVFDYEPIPEMKVDSNHTLLNITITPGQLRDLAYGVRELSRAGLVHGNIADKNILLKPHVPCPEDYFQERQRLILVDMGEVVPNYKGDAFALGEIFTKCIKQFCWDNESWNKIELASTILKQYEDLDHALEVMDFKLEYDLNGGMGLKVF